MKNDDKQLISKLGIIGIVVAVILAVVIVGISLSGSDDSRDCPPGTVWSESHQHCH